MVTDSTPLLPTYIELCVLSWFSLKDKGKPLEEDFKNGSDKILLTFRNITLCALHENRLKATKLQAEHDFEGCIYSKRNWEVSNVKEVNEKGAIGVNREIAGFEKWRENKDT